MADEVAEHNAAGLATTWVLPAGPCDEYDTFVRRVNEERIDCTNLWVFHMDEFLDWQCRPYPLADTYESLEGTMIACFYNRIDEELRPPEDHRIWPRLSNLDYPDEMCDKLGGVDTVWAGIGATGLVAFDEEPRDFWHRVTVDEYAASKTRVVDINSDTMAVPFPREMVEIVEKGRSGDWKGCIEAQQKVLRIRNVMKKTPFNAGWNWAMQYGFGRPTVSRMVLGSRS